MSPQLSRVDSMQTETVALPEDFRLPAPIAVPSLDELMSALGDLETPNGGPAPVAGHLHQRVESDAEDSAAMISPAIVFPEKFAALLPDSEIVLVAGQDHFPHDGAAAEIARIVSEWHERS